MGKNDVIGLFENKISQVADKKTDGDLFHFCNLSGFLDSRCRNIKGIHPVAELCHKNRISSFSAANIQNVGIGRKDAEMIFHIGSWTFGEGRNLQVRVGSFPERFVFHAFLTFRDERIPNHVGDEIDMLLES